jgi:hypothetical protein
VKNLAFEDIDLPENGLTTDESPRRESKSEATMIRRTRKNTCMYWKKLQHKELKKKACKFENKRGKENSEGIHNN